MVLVHQLQSLLAVAGPAIDYELWPCRQQSRQGFAQHGMVVGNNDADTPVRSWLCHEELLVAI
jgi:hypothetical protein